MSQIFDADEMQDEYVAKMGHDLGVRFHALRAGYSEAVWRWQQFTELFGEGEKRIDLLNRKAPLFFWLVQDALVDQTLLSITRLSEQPGSGTRRNLTVKCLPEFISDTELLGIIRQQFAVLDAKSKFAVDLRNKAIAHHDEPSVLRQGLTPLPMVTRDRITAALDAIGGVLCVVERHYMNRDFLDKVFDIGGGALALLYALRGDAGWDSMVERAIEENRFNPLEWEKFLRPI